MIRPPPQLTPTAPLFPYTTLCRSPEDRAGAEPLGDMVGDDYRCRADVVGGEAGLGDAGAADHRGTGGAHLHQLFEPALVAAAARGDAAFEPVRLEPQLGVEFFGGAGFLGEHRLHPGIEAAEADFLAADMAAVEPQRLARPAGQGVAGGAGGAH